MLTDSIRPFKYLAEEFLGKIT